VWPFRKGLISAFWSYLKQKAEAIPQTTKANKTLAKRVQEFIPSPETVFVGDIKRYRESKPDRFTCLKDVLTLRFQPSFSLEYLPEGTAGLPSYLRVVDIRAYGPEQCTELVKCLDERSQGEVQDAAVLRRRLCDEGALLVCQPEHLSKNR
jgi:hypothetical protein